MRRLPCQLFARRVSEARRRRADDREGVLARLREFGRLGQDEFFATAWHRRVVCLGGLRRTLLRSRLRITESLTIGSFPFSS